MPTVKKAGSAAPAAKSEKAKEGVYAYCMSTKQKELVDDAVITKTDKGQYIAKGTATKDKHKVSVIMSEAAAKEAVANKWAKKDY